MGEPPCGEAGSEPATAANAAALSALVLGEAEALIASLIRFFSVPLMLLLLSLQAGQKDGAPNEAGAVGGSMQRWDGRHDAAGGSRPGATNGAADAGWHKQRTAW